MPVLSFKAVLGLLFALLLLAIAVLSVVSYQNNQSTLQTSFWLGHTHAVIQDADQILSTYYGTRLNLNRMIITRDTSGTASYVQSMNQLSFALNRLRNRTSDNNHQQSNIDSLEAELHRFQIVSDSLLRLVTANQPEEVIRRLFVSSSDLRNEITLRIERIKNAEEILLAKRELANQESLASFTTTLIFLLSGIAVLLICTFLVVRYNFNKRKAAEGQMKNALQAEMELNKLKSSFVSLASHEFRTPLTTILSSAFLLEKYSFGLNQDKAAKHLARIKSSVSNLTSILDEFLSVTKIEEGQVQPNIETVDLQDFLGNICNDLQAFAKPGQTIYYSHSGSQEVKTDPVLLGNIIRNIVTNSIKYSAENSAIYVSSTVNSKIHLYIKDNGIGIPAADQKRLFERFYRASNAGTVQGTGLGLHIMKHYVQMLNGSIKLESEVGQGTKVQVIFDHTIAD